MMKFTTKAGTLLAISKAGTDFTILPQVSFAVGELYKSSEDIMAKIGSELPHGKYIVRSSAVGEDSITSLWRENTFLWRT